MSLCRGVCAHESSVRVCLCVGAVIQDLWRSCWGVREQTSCHEADNLPAGNARIHTWIHTHAYKHTHACRHRMKNAHKHLHVHTYTHMHAHRSADLLVKKIPDRGFCNNIKFVLQHVVFSGLTFLDDSFFSPILQVFTFKQILFPTQPLVFAQQWWCLLPLSEKIAKILEGRLVIWLSFACLLH